jgi:hypothetical protein
MKLFMAPFFALLTVASAFAQTDQKVADSFVGKWNRDKMTINGKQRQNIRLQPDGSIWFDTTDQNGYRVRKTGTWNVVKGQVKLLISPKKAGVGFDTIVFKRVDKKTITAVTYNPKVWGDGPITFTWGGSIPKI